MNAKAKETFRIYDKTRAKLAQEFVSWGLYLGRIDIPNFKSAIQVPF